MKNKKINVNIFLNILTIVLTCAMLAVGLIVNSAISIAIIVITSVFIIAIQIYNFLKYKQLLKKLLQEKEREEQKQKTINTLLDVYAILGIPPQYKPDGSLKDIFELLCITPVYDENGNRKLTIYEVLGINPKFTQSGIEVPRILRIKNRVNSLIKLDKSTSPLIYFPREKQIIGDKHILPTLKEEEKSKPDLKQANVVKPAAKSSTPSKKSEPVSYAKSIRQLPKAEKAAFGSTIKVEKVKLEANKKDEPKNSPIVDAIFKVTSDATKNAAGMADYSKKTGQISNQPIKKATDEYIKVADSTNSKSSSTITPGFKGQNINPQHHKDIFGEGFNGQFVKPKIRPKDLSSGFSGQSVEDDNQRIL